MSRSKVTAGKRGAPLGEHAECFDHLDDVNVSEQNNVHRRRDDEAALRVWRADHEDCAALRAWRERCPGLSALWDESEPVAAWKGAGA